MPPGFPGVTAGGDGPRGGGSAERMRRLRQRRAAERREAMKHAELLARRERNEQLPLLPVVSGADERAQGGRPRGSISKATAEFRRYFLERYPSPVIALAEMYARPVEELAQALGCSKLEAFREQRAAAAEVAPFIHSKMPIAVQGEGLPQVGITLAVSAEAAQQMGMVAPPVPLPKTVVNQALGEDDPA
jgi:hypothetical protein